MNIRNDLRRIDTLVAEIEEVIIDLENYCTHVENDKSVGPAELAPAFFDIKEKEDLLDATHKRFYRSYDRLNKHIFPTRLEDSGLDMVRVPDLARSFGIRRMMSASLLDKEKGFEWLRSVGAGDMIQQTVNAGTLAAYVRNLILEEGVEPPAEIVKVSPYNQIGVTKYSPNKGTKR